MSGKRIISSLCLAALLGGGLWYASTFSSEVKFSSSIPFIQSKPDLTILVTGDIMLDRNVRNIINKIGFEKFTEGIEDLIKEADIAVGNLEGPFTTYPSKTASLVSKELTFTFDPALVPKLGELGFDVFGLANNHTQNFGKEGISQTKKFLLDSNIYYYGDPNNKDGLSLVMERNGITVGFVGFHEFSYINFDKVLAEIRRIRPQVDFLIITPHWGIEYQKEPSESMKNWAYKFIDAGGDVVVGAHPHVIGEVEEYNGKKIFYSLGNFIFDQYFSKETSEGLVVKIALEKRGDILEPIYTLTRIVIDRDRVSVSE